MSNNMTRRSFLKCAGAATVAVGAASLLGGCTLFDGIINDAIGDARIVSQDGVLFTVGLVNTKLDADGKVLAFLPTVAMGNLNNVDKPVNAKHFSLKIDGVPMDIKYGAATDELTKGIAWDETEDVRLLDKDGKARVLSANGKMGYLVFVPKAPVESWKTAELTISYSGSTTFVIKAEGSVADIVKK